MAKTGRKANHYVAQDGRSIEGLTRQTDGRWRIIGSTTKFSEPDEAMAIAKFRKLTGKDATLEIPVPIGDDSMNIEERIKAIGEADNIRMTTMYLPDDFDVQGPIIPAKIKSIESYIKVKETVFWNWLRDQLLTNSLYISQRVGIPQVANLKSPAVTKATPFSDLLDNYIREANVGEKTFYKVKKEFKRFMKIVGKTTDDLSVKSLATYRKSFKPSWSAQTSKTKIAYIKSVFSLAQKTGLIGSSVDDALLTLRAPSVTGGYTPSPMAKEDFRTLLDGSDDLWRAILLLSLNCCLYLQECSVVKWDDLDLEKKTFVTRRAKTKVIRAATLWDETIEAVKKMKTKTDYVFSSTHGTSYSAISLRMAFAELRKRVGVNENVKFNHIRDGAYTAAVQKKGVEEKFARVLAGHKATGLQDNYVMRNPEITRDACDAVYAAYLAQ